jgi:septal ring factor EnvC (AmiA/AmiB activator)
MDKASEALFALKPVTFRYKREVDPAHALSFGLIAEEVAEISPELITRDEQGKPETVRYEAVNAMLLKEFLKEHKTVQEQGATMTQQRNDFEAAIARQQKQIEALTATVKEQAAQIQKVSAQLEVSKAAPQTVVNNQ